jgi:hypothetical protein
VPLRVLIVSGIWPPDVGGPASHGPGLGTFLQQRGPEAGAVTHFVLDELRALHSDAKFAIDEVSASAPPRWLTKLLFDASAR